MTFMEKRRPIWSWVFGNVPAITFSMLGIVAVALFIVSLVGDFEGWTAITAIGTIVLFALAVVAFIGGHKLEQHSEPVTYAPDFPGDRLDVDPDTGARRLHLESPPT